MSNTVADTRARLFAVVSFDSDRDEDEFTARLAAFEAAVLDQAATVAAPHADDCDCGGCAECVSHQIAAELRRRAATVTP